MTGYKTVSLETAKYKDAYSHAKELFFHLQEMVREGASLHERTFAQAWHEWFKEKVAEGAWTDSRRKWHLNYFNLYFNRYWND